MLSTELLCSPDQHTASVCMHVQCYYETKKVNNAQLIPAGFPGHCSIQRPFVVIQPLVVEFEYLAVEFDHLSAGVVLQP